MNFSAIIGFAICVSVLVLSVMQSQGARAILLNEHAILIVIGGTMASTFICFPIQRVFTLTLVAIRKLVGLRKFDYQEIINEVIGIADTLQRDPNALRSMASGIKDHFLKEGIELLAGGVTEDQLTEIMGTRIETFKRQHTAEANMFRTIGRFPPAFGLLGTTLGMITLLYQLGGADAQKLVGPSMAIGLVATLYGIGLTNFLFIPIAENLTLASSEDLAARKMILEGLRMIKRKVHPILVEEMMKSYLMPQARSALKSKGKLT